MVQSPRRTRFSTWVTIIILLVLVASVFSYIKLLPTGEAMYLKRTLANTKETIQTNLARVTGRLIKQTGLVVQYQAPSACENITPDGEVSMIVASTTKTFVLPCTIPDQPIEVGATMTITYQTNQCSNGICRAVSLNPARVLGDALAQGGGYSAPIATTFFEPPAPDDPPTNSSIAWITIPFAILATLSTLATVGTVLGTTGSGILQSSLPFLGLGRQKSHWGRVVENRSNKPISDALIIFFDAEGRPKQTVKSRDDGTFKAVLPKGTYQLKIARQLYELEQTPTDISLFPDEILYTGGTLHIENDDQVAPIVLAMRAVGREQITERKMKDSWKKRLSIFQAKWAVPVLFIGAGVHAWALTQSPTPLFVGIAVIYVVFLINELLVSRTVRRAVGKIRSSSDKQPVSQALIRLIDKATNTIVATKMSLSHGQFLLTPPPGNYVLQVLHGQYAPYTETNLTIGKWNPSAAKVNIELNQR